MIRTGIVALALGVWFSPAMAGMKLTDECEKEVGGSETKEQARAILKCMADSVPPVTYFIEDFGVYDPNSAGGVEPYVEIVNPNKQSALKYLRVQMTLYNEVGDVVRSTIGGQSTAWISFTGPLTADEGAYKAKWDPVWYNKTGYCVKIQAITVEFMNGKKLSFSGSSLAKAIASDMKNDCTVKTR